MGLATIFIFTYIRLSILTLRINTKTLLWYTFAGIVVALHWGTFFTALLEPILFKRKVVGYELLFGVLVMLGLYPIFRVERN